MLTRLFSWSTRRRSKNQKTCNSSTEPTTASNSSSSKNEGKRETPSLLLNQIVFSKPMKLETQYPPTTIHTQCLPNDWKPSIAPQTLLPKHVININAASSVKGTVSIPQSLISTYVKDNNNAGDMSCATEHPQSKLIGYFPPAINCELTTFARNNTSMSEQENYFPENKLSLKMPAVPVPGPAPAPVPPPFLMLSREPSIFQSFQPKPPISQSINLGSPEKVDPENFGENIRNIIGDTKSKKPRKMHCLLQRKKRRMFSIQRLVRSGKAIVEIQDRRSTRRPRILRIDAREWDSAISEVASS